VNCRRAPFFVSGPESQIVLILKRFLHFIGIYPQRYPCPHTQEYSPHLSFVKAGKGLFAAREARQ
jgi:hypothetical protein